jgi:Transposase DDE domain
LEEEHQVHRRANEAYEAYRARGVMKDGRRFGKPPTPYQPPARPEGKVNITDPDSRNVKTPRGYLQGYNAQAVCDENQLVVAAEINTDSPDFGHLEPMVFAAERELAWAGIAAAPGVVVADAGYSHHDQMDQLAGRGIRALIPPTPASAEAPGRAGTAAVTCSWAECSRPISASGSTADAR